MVEELNKKVKVELVTVRKEKDLLKSKLRNSDPESRKLAAEADELLNQWKKKRQALDRHLEGHPDVKKAAGKHKKLEAEFKRLVVLESHIRNRIKILKYVVKDGDKPGAKQ